MPKPLTFYRIKHHWVGMNGIILCDCHSAAVLILWPCWLHSGYFMAPCEHRAELAALYHCADKAGTCQWLEMLMGLGVGFKHLEWQHPSSTSAGCTVGLLVAFHTLWLPRSISLLRPALSPANLSSAMQLKLTVEKTVKEDVRPGVGSQGTN